MKSHSLLRLFAAASMTAFAVTTACAADSDLKRADKNFVETAYQDGLAEVKMGELAVAKSANAEVKAFGQHMIDDHGKANAELKILADSKKVAVASDPSMVAQGKAKMIDAKTGADFDKAFAQDMVKNHKKAVELFEKASQEVTDSAIKDFATKTLPTLKSHLTMAEELQGKVGK
jgi:putative membrane protein